MKEFMKTYSLADIAKHIGKQRTTLSNWIPIFKPYLPTVGTGKSKRYKQSALEIFSLISRMKDASEPNELIILAIKQISNEIMVEDEEDNQPKPLYNEIIDGFNTMMDTLTEQNELLLEQAEKREKDFDELRRMFEEQKGMMQEMQNQSVENANTLSNQMTTVLEDNEARKREIKERDDRLMESLTALTRTTKESNEAMKATAASEEKKKSWFKLFQR